VDAEVQIYSFFNLGAREGGCQWHVASALAPGKRHGTHWPGHWMGHKTGLLGCGKAHSQRDSISKGLIHFLNYQFCVHVCPYLYFCFLSLIYVPSSRMYHSSLASLLNFRKIYQFTYSFLVIFYIFKLQLLFNHLVVFLTIFQAQSQFC
jgi:hypothetical protein